MKTIEERIKEIKHCGECAIYCMSNHKVPWLPDDGSFDNTINSMRNAQTKHKLSQAYYNYINLCINHGYSDGEIIAGIMQNDAKNKEFDVNIDSVIKSLIEIKYTTVKLSEPTIQQEKAEAESTKPVVQPIVGAKFATEAIKEVAKPTVEPDKNNSSTDNSAGGIKVNDKIVYKISKKVDYMNNLLKKLINNQDKDLSGTAKSIKSIAEETKQMILSVDPTSCSEETIASLNDSSVAIDEAIKIAESVLANNTTDTKQEVVAQTTTAQSSAAANTVGGFNISNFIKQDKQPVKGPNMPANNGNGKSNQQQKQTVFPHQICGLTDDQIIAEVRKHFKVLQQLPAYALYDLLNNKFLAKKMKELDAKQRPNNPYLTQVNMNEYIDVPELLEKYSLCFTMPCNDKTQVIMVLFNPIPVPDKNGVLQYPLNIFKATKTNNANK